MDHGYAGHILGGPGQYFKVLGKPPVIAQPGEHPFHDPALGDDGKGTLDLLRNVQLGLQRRFHKFDGGAAVARIARKRLQGSVLVGRRFQHAAARLAVMFVCPKGTRAACTSTWIRSPNVSIYAPWVLRCGACGLSSSCCRRSPGLRCHRPS